LGARRGLVTDENGGRGVDGYNGRAEGGPHASQHIDFAINILNRGRLTPPCSSSRWRDLVTEWHRNGRTSHPHCRGEWGRLAVGVSNCCRPVPGLAPAPPIDASPLPSLSLWLPWSGSLIGRRLGIGGWPGPARRAGRGGAPRLSPHRPTHRPEALVYRAPCWHALGSVSRLDSANQRTIRPRARVP